MIIILNRLCTYQQDRKKHQTCFIINQPSLVQNTKTLPALGTSDHDIVFHEMNITIGRKHKTPRTINQYKKADWDKIHTELKTFQEHYFCKQTTHYHRRKMATYQNQNPRNN